MQKRFANFDFKQDTDTGGLLSIPYSWVVTDVHNTYAYWPPSNSADERCVQSLIRRSSEPNVTLWIRLPGQLKGVHDSLAEAEQALKLLCGESITETEDERLAAAQMNAKLASEARPSSFSHSDSASAVRTAAKKTILSIPAQSELQSTGTRNAESERLAAVGEAISQRMDQTPASSTGHDLDGEAAAQSSEKSPPLSAGCEQSLEGQQKSDAKRKLDSLIAHMTTNTPERVQQLTGQQLTDSESDIMTALGVINDNIMAHMVSHLLQITVHSYSVVFHCVISLQLTRTYLQCFSGWCLYCKLVGEDRLRGSGGLRAPERISTKFISFKFKRIKRSFYCNFVINEYNNFD